MLPRSLYGELGGPGWGLSANWDTRFKTASQWGYRVGLSWAGQWDNTAGIHTHTMYYGLTTGVNNLIGKRKSKLELGVGKQFCERYSSIYKKANCQTDDVTMA